MFFSSIAIPVIALERDVSNSQENESLEYIFFEIEVQDLLSVLFGDHEEIDVFSGLIGQRFIRQNSVPLMGMPGWGAIFGWLNPNDLVNVMRQDGDFLFVQVLRSVRPMDSNMGYIWIESVFP